jgi:mevalonate kinase
MIGVSTTILQSVAPGKVILFGEHAVNRGQLAIGCAVGLTLRCRLSPRTDGAIALSGAGQRTVLTLEHIRRHFAACETALRTSDFAAIRALLGDNFFASSVYVLGLADRHAPLASFEIAWTGSIPAGAGLGSGGAAHAALALVLAEWQVRQGSLAESACAATTAAWAYGGDRIAHGGTASALDTQSSLCGGVIEFRDGGAGQTLPFSPGLRLVIGHTGVPKGSTGSVNARVRSWLEADPARLSVFQEIGDLAARSRPLIAAGDWPAVGALMNANHALLGRIGASHPQLDALCAAARRAGAYGAKLTGAGGGGVMITLVGPGTERLVVDAIAAAGGTPICAPVAVGGAAILPG